MRKILTLLIVAVLAVSVMVPAAFAAGTTPAISGTTVETQPGQTVSVSFSLSPVTTLATFQVKLGFNSDVLTLKNISGNGMVAPNYATGEFNVISVTDYEAGALFVAQFEVAADAKPGDYTVTATPVLFALADRTKFDVSAGSGLVVIPCNHVPGAAATCTTAQTCTICGAELVGELGHDFTEVVANKVPATCTTDGKEAVMGCTRCDEEQGGEPIEALKHAYGTASYNWSADGKSCTATRTCANDASHVETASATVTSAVTTPATCTVKGTTTYTATFAEDWAATQTKDVQDIPVLDHTYDQKVVEDKFKKSDATCTAKAVYYFSCSCGEKGTATFETGDLKAHTPGAAATCTTAQICTVCQKELAAKLGHDLKDTAYKAPTCEGEGVEDGKECTRCDYVEGKKVIPALGHDYEGVVTKEPTCEDKGVKTYTCKNDSKHTYTEDIKALGHKWDDGKVTKEPTCEEKGVKTFTCKNDAKHTKTEDIKALGHKWDKGVVTKKATCTTEGEMTYTCQNDKTHTKTEKIKALGHDIDSEKYGSDSKGNHWLICNTCGEIASEKVPHNFNVKGTDGYWYCVCGAKGDKIETDTGKDEQPKNGDITPYFVMGVATLVAMSAAVVYVDKKRKTR